jgi:tetratricopeptide (TPR) repeat protein
VSEDLNHLAVGLCDGTVWLFRGDDLFREKNLKPVILKESLQKGNISPITGLAFRGSKPNTVLFVVSSNSVSAYSWRSVDGDISRELLEEGAGGEMGCTTLSDNDELVVGRKDAFYFYEPEGRGPCIAVDTNKKIMTWFRSYLVVVSQDSQNLRSNAINIYDRKNKLIVYSENFPTITHVVSEWGSVFILTSEHKLYQLEEVDTQSKLEKLYNKHLFSVAINLALSQNYDYGSVLDIFRKFGDHLYSKGDYDGAIVQYNKTIGRLEPSYVIRRFLDAQRIHNLTSYLEALHEKGVANGDHTTLLFNCYTKMKDAKKLDTFIKSAATKVDKTEKETFLFDIETAIKACRQAGYFQHALDLAEQHHHTQLYLRILLEDLRQYDKALEYFEKLDHHEAEANIKQYGKILLAERPQKTTEFLCKLCLRSSSSSSSTSHGDDEKFSNLPEELFHIFVNQAEAAETFLEFLVQNAKPSPFVFQSLLELYLRSSKPQSSLSSTTITTTTTSILLSKQEEESLNPSQMNNKPDQKRTKAEQLLKSNASKFDKQNALVVCKVNDFKEGVLFLLEELKLFNEVIQYHMENNDHQNVIKACQKFGYFYYLLLINLYLGKKIQTYGLKY